MAGIRKHGAHRQSLSITSTAIGTAAPAAMFVYDAYAAQQGGTTIGPVTGFDQALETVTEMNLVLDTTLNGAATNYTTFVITHRDKAAATVDQFSIVCSTTAYVFTAFIAANLGVASGATIPGGGTGTLTIGTGVALPWTLKAGDTIAFTTTITGNGVYSGGASLNFLIQAAGA